MISNIKIETYDSGKIKRQSQYKGDKQHGQWVLFFENGLVEWIGNYYERKEVGVWLEWYENGIKKEESSYSDGNKVPLNFWDEKGNVTLRDGTGYVICKFGSSEGDVYHQFYENGIFQNEKKISGAIFGDFKKK